MEKIHKNIRVFMLSCIKYACFHVFSPFSAYFSPHDIIAEKGLLIGPGTEATWLSSLMLWLSLFLQNTGLRALKSCYINDISLCHN